MLHINYRKADKRTFISRIRMSIKTEKNNVPYNYSSQRTN